MREINRTYPTSATAGTSTLFSRSFVRSFVRSFGRSVVRVHLVHRPEIRRSLPAQTEVAIVKGDAAV